MKKIVLGTALLASILLSAVYGLFSYIFIDPALLTMIGQTKPGILVIVGSLQRSIPLDLVNILGIILLIILGLVALILLISKKEISRRIFILTLVIPCILALAYPMISRDIFSYLYYGKMVLVHHQNPYVVTPLANSSVDLWLGFVHNTERVYTYGPIALLLNLIPMSLLGAEKLLVNFFVYKITCLGFFLWGTYLLLKLIKSRNLAIILWVLNPFVLNELLINGHNDLLMIVLFWWAVDLAKKPPRLWSLVAYALSVATKFVTAPLLPILFLSKDRQRVFAIWTLILIPLFLMYHGYLTWYFAWLYFCLPYLKLSKMQIFSLLLLQLSLTLGYAGFLETGMWGPDSSSSLVALIANTKNVYVYLFILTMLYPGVINLKSHH